MQFLKKKKNRNAQHLETKGSLGPVKVLLARVVDGDADALHVLLVARVDVGGEGLQDGVAALRLHEPGAAGKVVLVVDDEVEDAVELVVGEAVDRLDAVHLALDGVDGLGVLEVPLRHLHVARALAGPAGELVALVLEVARLEGHEGEERRLLVGRGEAVRLHAGEEEGAGLLRGAALVGEVGAGARRRLGCDLLDDAGRGLDGRGGGGRGESGQGANEDSRELHDGGGCVKGFVSGCVFCVFCVYFAKIRAGRLFAKVDKWMSELLNVIRRRKESRKRFCKHK